MLKVCTTCKSSTNGFYKDKSSKDGLYKRCKVCHKKSARNWKLTNQNRNSLIKRQWQEVHAGKVNAISGQYRSSKIHRTPKWLTADQLAQIERYYIVAEWIKSVLGEPIEVDHIIPLQGDNVSELHVPWNLQLLTKHDNCSKSNKFISEST